MKKTKKSSSKKPKPDSKKKKKIFYLICFAAIVVIFLYSVWWPSSQLFGKTIYKNKDSVTLTFDDGPGADTETILKILKENNTTAVFFITCEHINESEPNIIKKMSDDGNIVALHGYAHRKFQGYDELNACKQILENITGKEVVYFRPPYGFKSPNTMSAAKKLNLTVVTWSVFPRDNTAKNPDQIIKRVERNLKSNSIICFHDGPAHRENTANALPEIISYINQKEYKIQKAI